MDIALQKAKLEFMKTGSVEERMPYYWSAAILAGKTDAVRFNKPDGLESLIRGAVIVVLFLSIIVLLINYRKVDVTFNKFWKGYASYS